MGFIFLFFIFTFWRLQGKKIILTPIISIILYYIIFIYIFCSCIVSLTFLGLLEIKGININFDLSLN